MTPQKFTDQIITLRASATSTKPKGVDKENRMMRGVVVAEAIQIKDYRGSWYGLALDDEFITSLAAYGKKQKNGVICNFGHNYNNLGRRLGRMSNFSLDGGKVYADLSILKSADSAPGMNGLGTHVLELADEDAGTMMFSIKFDYEYLFQRDTAGAEVKCYYYDKKDNYIYPNEELGAVYFKFKSLSAVDLVDEGAATNSLFSSQDELADAAQALLSAPGIEDVLASNKYPVLERLYGAPKSTDSIIDSLKALLGLTKKDESLSFTPKEETVDITQLQADLAAAQAALQVERDTATQLQADNAALTTQVADASAQFTALSARIEALEKLPAATHTLGNEEKEDPQPVKLRAYEANPLNAKWMEKQKAK